MDHNSMPEANLTDQMVQLHQDPEPDLAKNLKFADSCTCTAPHTNLDLHAQGEFPKDVDFRNEMLRYISHMLFKEDGEDKALLFQESAALQAAEKWFYKILTQHCPSSMDLQNIRGSDNIVKNPDVKCLNEVVSHCSHGPNSGFDPICNNSCSSYGSSSSSGGMFVDGPMGVIQFKKGLEEMSKLIPNCCSNLFIDLTRDETSNSNHSLTNQKLDKEEPHGYLLRGKKHHFLERSQDESRCNKQSAVDNESTVSPDMFDKVLLCTKGKDGSKEMSKSTTKTGQPDKTGGKKKGFGKRNVVDMRALLTLCAQAVASDDRRAANEFLKQIRQHSSPTGDGMQRLAHYFACGLEARMIGSATQIYRSLLNMPTSASDLLKAYQIYLENCPFRKVSNFFANKSIMNASEEAKALHIVDFGILYGFQWPVFLQHLGSRPGGPPRLRITGIDLPCPGFKPYERVEETGWRLARYAKKFKVPFEFNAIAQKFETVGLEDLRIDKDEMLVVNCLFRFKNLLDETVVINSPRNKVLELIKKMNPTLFVLGITNGSFSAPFFITRFREALFYYSSFFDMLDNTIPREIHERALIERTIIGREAMNVIACEAAERIERPETYRQWQARNVRAGFEQLGIDEEIMERAKNRVRMSYHKDFVIDRDGHWLLQGWKGRIVYALSAWRPAY